MKKYLSLLAILCLAAPLPGRTQTATPAASPAPPAAAGPMAADTSETVSGFTLTIPKEWSERRSGTMVILSPPENDAQIVLVPVGAASNAQDAIAKAWQSFQPGFARKVETTVTPPARQGWDRIVALNYVTSPEEHAVVQATALLVKDQWLVAIATGSLSTFEKRGAAAGLVFSSLQPAGHVRESFAGRTAHRLTPARVAELLAFLKTGMQELHIPGVGVAMIDHGRVVYEGGVGVRQLGTSQPVDKNTLFMIASNTKGLTTLMLARLVDQGKLRWDERVTDVYPSFRLGSAATTARIRIEDLICACTGVPRKDFDWILGTTPQTGPEETFVQLAHTEPTSNYGEVFQYSNTMASAAGYIAGHIEYPNLSLGAAYDKAMQALVFDPLGMTRTTFDMQAALASDHAAPHGQTIDGATRVVTSPINEIAIPYRPAGEAWSTPHDLIKYVQDEITEGVLPNGTRLISAKNLLQRRVHTVPVGRDVWYGMGLMDDRSYGISVIHHGGDLIGYHSDIIAIPSAKVGAVILTNADTGVELRGPFLRRILEVLYDGRPEAAEDVRTQAANDAQAIAAERKLMTLPAAPEYAARLAPYYTNDALGHIAVHRGPGGVVFDFGLWSSSVATRANPDGTISFLTADPGVGGFEFVMPKDGGAQLTTRDGQHLYTYTAGLAHSKM
ncbi:MAG TPA: serine hydrolase domain-containing protein [Candidatus Baltobacteraceae bacterium]|nr:serine hydrolase domain-containing protein [Candidatus Baltobacteraceae bacterium]